MQQMVQTLCAGPNAEHAPMEHATLQQTDTFTCYGLLLIGVQQQCDDTQRPCGNTCIMLLLYLIAHASTQGTATM